MFGLDLAQLGFVALVVVAVAALAYVFFFESIASQKKTEERLNEVKLAATDSLGKFTVRDKQAEAIKRRKSVQDTLKDLEQRQKLRDKNIKSPPLKMLIQQAGMKVTMPRFYLYSALAGIVATVLGLLFGSPLYLAPGLFLAGALGLPRWFIYFRRRRRIKAFLNEFPNAIDVIVRAIRSGLPLNDGIRLIAQEAQEPVRGEFRRIVDNQQVGVSIPEAAMRMSEYMPCAEASFFGIVIQIQSQAGGNLSEALGNLSRVLRDRKKMAAKVQALSMEAKASAYIIGALPFIVAFLVYLTSPKYIMILFNTSSGNFLLACAGAWMSIGIMVMKKMINFKF
ncbi:type II secretion system F family protein [Phyllobacterium endophyticum]|uniref:Pilus assembly protein n=1 Tax=Phyllobacterium endophyticum TaxID=1149773 RepID=A0A2P7B0J6_9HYPH|nr:type II secretion system F family protein [Phyllobacterium endophyticum]MBB3235338.1 tight adherence protein B [Phyllobacterium endophyticum]PSH59975.1 pilus assembly protein [Phyllobacterium endophyticum]TXR49968.1 type II secretion system F family protein [Phyllobacterium endophyticum]TYR42146.1 type II secretion system F family protein [Phyllobacterium endophyticum]